MGDKFQNPLDKLSGSDETTPAQRRTRKDFSRPTDRLDKSSVRRAVKKDSTIAGQYKRKTITLPPDQIDYIDELRQQEGVGVLAFYRWLIDQGLQAYEEGARPEPDGEVVHDIKLGHWSSRPDG